MSLMSAFVVRKIFAQCVRLVVPLLLLLAGCGGIPDTSYYTVVPQFETPVLGNNHQPAPTKTIRVERFTADILYEDDRIIYRESEYEVKYYNYRRWAATPRYLVTDRIVDNLRQSGLFHEVLSGPSLNKTDFLLSGRLLAFEEWDRGEQWFGTAAITVQLREANSGDLLWSGEFRHETPANQKLPSAVVAAISHSLQQCANEVIDSLRNLL